MRRPPFPLHIFPIPFLSSFYFPSPLLFSPPSCHPIFLLLFFPFSPPSYFSFPLFSTLPPLSITRPLSHPPPLLPPFIPLSHTLLSPSLSNSPLSWPSACRLRSWPAPCKTLNPAWCAIQQFLMQDEGNGCKAMEGQDSNDARLRLSTSGKRRPPTEVSQGRQGNCFFIDFRPYCTTLLPGQNTARKPRAQQ